MASRLRYTYRGLVVPVFTPFKSNSERTINPSVIPKYADYLKSKKLAGVLVNGTTGEGMTMSASERKQIAEAWAESARRNEQHLVVQVGGAPLADVKDLAKHAQSLRADAILCLPELYYKPKTEQQLIDYLCEVSACAPDTPLLYYHFPLMSNVTIHMAKFLESVGNKIPNLVGIKFTSTNLEEASQALRVENNRYVLFLGSNQIIPAGGSVGIDSFMPSSTNLFPELLSDIVSACKAGDFATAKSKQEKLSRAFDKLSQLGHPIASMKAALSHLSPIEIGPSRKPLPSYDSQKDQTRVREILKSLD